MQERSQLTSGKVGEVNRSAPPLPWKCRRANAPLPSSLLLRLLFYISTSLLIFNCCIHYKRCRLTARSSLTARKDPHDKGHLRPTRFLKVSSVPMVVPTFRTALSWPSQVFLTWKLSRPITFSATNSQALSAPNPTCLSSPQPSPE